MNVLIINGPNLNLIGSRETGIYGEQSFETFLEALRSEFPEVSLTYYQTNVEGEIVNKIHEAHFHSFDGIVLNAGGYTHTSVAIGDAIKAIKIPVIEVHISNVMAREEFRRISLISSSVKGIISGFGLYSYSLGIKALSQMAVKK